MSTIIMAAVWPLPMPPAQKAVLVSLADQANDQGGCWPAVATLVERTCLSERTVQRALRWLEDRGVVVVDRRNKGDGSMSSNLYTVRPDRFVPESVPENAQNGAGCHGDTPRHGDTPGCHGDTTPPRHHDTTPPSP